VSLGATAEALLAAAVPPEVAVVPAVVIFAAAPKILASDTVFVAWPDVAVPPLNF
jgi:hypothetical protein